MKKNDVETGATYVAKVSGKPARVRIERASPYGGWEAINVETGRRVRIKSAQRLRFEAAGPKRAMAQSADAQNRDACATVGCDRPAALTCLGRPRVQACYEDEVETEDNQPVAECATDTETPDYEENDMATKITKKSAKKATRTARAAKTATKPKAAAKPKARRPPATPGRSASAPSTRPPRS